MRLPELIHLSGHSASTVVRRLRKDAPRSIFVGRERLFDRADALAWIARNRGERAPRPSVIRGENT